MANNSNTWRTFPIFISSTFKDMDAERDLIKKKVIPQLEETLRDRRIEFKIIDLRWGVNTGKIDESERESAVLKVCLDSIKNNRPFFVALLGNRYGWVPPQSRWENVYHTLSTQEKQYLDKGAGKSVTEIEILFGALGNVNEILSRSLFYFRREESYKDMPDEKYNADFQENVEESRQKLLNLKAQIKQICNENNYSDAIQEYSLKWNVSENKFDDNDFYDKIYKHLLKEIEEEIEDTKHSTATNWYEEEENALNNFIHFQTKHFTGREKLIARLKDFALNNSQALILTGFSGCGKSAVFCKLYQELQVANNSRQIVLAHSAGVTANSQYVETMLQLWNKQLADILQLDDSVTDESGKPFAVLLKDKFLSLAKNAQDNNYKLIILLDALDRFEWNTIAEYMQWLPQGVSLIATSLPDAAEKPKKIYSDLKIESIDIFTESEAKKLVERLGAEINKEIPQRVLNAIISKKDTNGQNALASPLWLLLATNILFGLDADDFREMRLRTEEDEIDKIENFLCELLDRFPTDAGELFIEIINRAANDYGQNLIHKTMNYIAVSHEGLREKDLAALLCNDWDELKFAQLRRWIGRLITETGANRQWNFAHHKLILTLQKQLSTQEKDLHKSLSDYLLTLHADDPLHPTVMYHLIKADDKKRAALFYVTTKKDVNRTLKVFYNNDHSFLNWLTDAAQYLDAQQKCDYAERLVRQAFPELTWTDYENYINMCKNLFNHINTTTTDLSQRRVIGRICQDITLWCKHKNDTENLLYFSQIQVDCYTVLVRHDPSDEVMKNCLAIALSALGDYYTSIGDTKKAMIFYEQLITL